MFPREIIENILYHCDGKTLKVAENVHEEWKQVVEYLAMKRNIWKRCCRQDIPEPEMLQYKTKWIGDYRNGDQIRWNELYDNWLSWQHIAKNIEFQMGTHWKINKISCISVIGDYLAIGLENGSVKVFDKNGKSLKTYRHLVVQVQSIHFVPDSIDDRPPTELLIAYPNKVFINDFRNAYAHGVFQNCYIFSTYKHFICGVSAEGRITIARVINDEERQQKSYQVVTYVRIYSPDTVKSCTLWEGVCIILVNDKVKIINYKEGSKSSHFMAIELTSLQFSFRDNFTMRRDVSIFHNKVIVTITKSSDIMQQQLFELFLLNDEEKRNSKKMFMPWQTFNAFITCCYLYGNTLVIGSSNGFAYFYEIHDWKLFDIANYSEAISVADFVPIISIDAVECYGKRIFYIASSTSVRTVTGISKSVLETK